MPAAPANQTQMRYARIAGFVFLLLIVMFMGGQLITSHIAGSGDFTDLRSHRIIGLRVIRRGSIR